MSALDMTQKETSVDQHAEDVELDAEAAVKSTANAAKGGDRAAQLIGTQHVVLTEEDVSSHATGQPRRPLG